MNFYSLDVEIEKLERRKVRYKEDYLGPLKSSFSRIETPFPQLPLPSVSPMSSNLCCTKEKVLFMNKLGLKRVAPKEKKGLFIFRAIFFVLK